jgi:hypothetical protein
MRIGKYQHISVPLLILNISFFENHQCIAKAVSISFMATLQENRSNQSAALKCASGHASCTMKSNGSPFMRDRNV